MASTQAPKGFGILFAIVGIPLIIWNAAEARNELDEVYTASGSAEARTERCMEISAEALPDVSIRHPVCECVVEKAASRGAFKDHGAYDEDLLKPIIDDCYRGDWD